MRAFIVTLFLLCSTAEGYGQTRDGFYLRLNSGLGNLRASEKAIEDEFTLTGVSGISSIAVGHSVATNSFINVDVFAGVVLDPSLDFNRAALGRLTDAEMSVAGIGVGITHYFMPANFYIAGSLGLATAELSYANTTIETDSGWGINAVIGKEWWVSKSWSLGLSGQYFYVVVPDKSINSNATFDLKARSFGILLSASFNK